MKPRNSKEIRNTKEIQNLSETESGQQNIRVEHKDMATSLITETPVDLELGYFEKQPKVGSINSSSRYLSPHYRES